MEKMLQLKNRKEVKQMKQVFVSFHYNAKDQSIHGFGNYIGEFDEEAYQNDLRNFILDLEKTIAKVFEDKTKIECAVKIMFFR